MIHTKTLAAIIFIIALATAAGHLAFRSRPNVKIGILSTQSGRRSQLGICARNAVIIGVDMINASGGVNGGKIELLIADDGNRPETARKGIEKLAAAGVTVIIGPVTSSMSVPAAEYAKTLDILLISPTATSLSLSGLDDNFIRVLPDVRAQAEFIAGFLVERRIQTLAIVMDTRNKEYSIPLAEHLRNVSAGHVAINEFPVNFIEIDYAELTGNIHKNKPGAILAITSDIDAATLFQQLRKLNYQGEKLGTFWACSDCFIRHGGKSVEGAFLVSSVHDSGQSPQLQEFTAHLKQRFGNNVNIFSIYAYDALMLAVQGMKNSGSFKPADIKRAIISQSSFQGLRDSFSIDANGDAQRQFSMVTVHNGQYIPIKRQER